MLTRSECTLPRPTTEVTKCSCHFIQVHPCKAEVLCRSDSETEWLRHIENSHLTKQCYTKLETIKRLYSATGERLVCMYVCMYVCMCAYA